MPISIQNMKKLAEIITAAIDEDDGFTLFVWENDGVHHISSLDGEDTMEHVLAWAELEAEEKEPEIKH